jgi:neutral amino acid transport system ATP-binding protein
MLNNLISVKNLKKAFGGITAVDVKELAFIEGELTSVIGPNGAGKTTFFDLISGFQNADSGDIFLKENNISNSQPYKIARMGMVRTFQLTKVFDRMTVMENLLFSGSNVNNDSFLRSILKLNSQKVYENSLKDKANEIMNDLNIGHMADSYARELSGGQKKLLELARAIINEPEILLLDEPLAGVNPKLAEDILSLIKKLSEDGITIVMVEHNIEAVMKISERVVVLAEGSLIADGSPNEIRTDKNVIEAYLGKADE